MRTQDRTALEEIYACPLRGEVIDSHSFAENKSCCGITDTAEIYECRLYDVCSIVPVPDGDDHLPMCVSCFEVGFKVGDLDHNGNEIQ